MRTRTLIVAAFGAVGLFSAAGAQTPTAIVEEVKGNVAGVEFMDYVHPGKVIKLGANGSIVLSYLASCVRETIKGGVVVVGTEESKVSLAEIESSKVACDASPSQLSDREASQSAATTFRTLAPQKAAASAAPVAPKLTVYGLSPVFEISQQGNLVIERTDATGGRDEVKLDPKLLIKGKFYDMAKAGKSLTPGASYTASVGSRRIAFKVDPLAKPGAAPLPSRLLHL